MALSMPIFGFVFDVINFILICHISDPTLSDHSPRNQRKTCLMEKSGKKLRLNCFANVSENVDIALFISISFQRLTVSNVTFCYTADRFESRNTIVSQGKVN